MSSASKITLYTVGTPNGWKASIALEELGVSYDVRKIDFGKLEQKEEWFLNGAILIYLAEHYDPEHKILSADPSKRSEAIQWVMWQMGGLGPMQGQLNHFNRYAPEKIPYAINRYRDETLRLFKTLERALSDGREYIVGDYSIADIACFGWVACYDWSGVSITETPLLEKWLFRVGEREAVRKGMNVPAPSTLIEDGFKVKISEEEQKKRAAEATKWILEEQAKSKQN
ncbi:hypothetical protein HDU67_007770 [Dinochytrium kinnereticum]|nr:hypothetical protein HDU67_007770 [Dinochytrium kinnereticum]